MINLNVHVYPASLKTQSRIQKELLSLKESGLISKILFVGLWESGLPKTDIFSPGIEILYIKVPKPIGISIIDYLVRYFFFNFKVISFLKTINFQVINSHNLSVLPVGVYFKLTKKVYHIYDAHELETEVEGAKGIKKIFGKLVEKKSMKYIDSIIVVSESIKNWYKENYGIKNVTVVRNIPVKTKIDSTNFRIELNKRLNLIDSDLLFIYQGLLSKARGLQIILDSFLNIGTGYHILFLGNGPMFSEISKIATENINIHCIESISTQELPKYTASVDVGIHIIPNSCLNHYFCLPNKVFEYLLYGVPQIISDFPDMKVVLDNGNCGWAIQPKTENLINIIKSINKEIVFQKKQNIIEFRENFGWQNEAVKLIDVYKVVTRE